MTRKTFVITAVIFLLGIGIGVLFTSRYSLSPSQNKPVEITQEAASTGVIAGTTNEIARVIRVIDGDTIEIADGRKVRYIGIDTPETVDPRKPVGCFGREASSKNRELVENADVELENDVSETDRYGRLLRYVYIIIPGRGRVMVNEELVQEGFAQSSIFPPDVKHQEIFRKAEIEAIAGKKGLWGSCVLASPSPTPAVSQPLPEVESASTTQMHPPTPNDNVVKPTPTVNSDCRIKGNISSSGEKIYHLPGCGSYDKTAIDESRGERWFCAEDEAVAAGWRKAKNC